MNLVLGTVVLLNMYWDELNYYIEMGSLISRQSVLLPMGSWNLFSTTLFWRVNIWAGNCRKQSKEQYFLGSAASLHLRNNKESKHTCTEYSQVVNWSFESPIVTIIYTISDEICYLSWYTEAQAWRRPSWVSEIAQELRRIRQNERVSNAERGE